jgi:hypothetical protein
MKNIIQSRRNIFELKKMKVEYLDSLMNTRHNSERNKYILNILELIDEELCNRKE